jgi:uncharacterized membrane protein
MPTDAARGTRRPDDAVGFDALQLKPPSAAARDAALASRRLLQRSGAVALAALLLGQGLFLGYLFGTFGRTALVGDFAAWSRFSAKGWVSGDTVGNAAMLAHIALALVVLSCGAIQLLPVVRRRAPRLHRLSGRAYLVGCLVAAVSGLVLVWGRGTVGDIWQHIAITINALLLLAGIALTWRTARARAFAEHRRWALRTFLVAGGVFYFRLLFSLWVMIHRAPVGFDPKTFSGPFLTTLAFFVYVVGPLTIFELYRRAEQSRRVLVHRAATGLVAVCALLALAGSVSAPLLLWWPRLRA